MDGTDADGEFSEEEVLRSGSQTGVSDQEDSPPIRIKRPTTPLASLSMITDSHSRLHSFNDSSNDPVTSILDRIDAELEAMDKTTHKSSKSSKFSSSTRGRASPQTKSPSALTILSGDTGFGSDTYQNEADQATNYRAGGRIEGSAQIYSDAHLTDGLTDDDVTVRRHDDNPSDLDSVAAQQIDLKFKEIMRKKKDESPPPPETPKSSLRSRRNSTGSGSKIRPSARKVRVQTPPPSSLKGDNYVPPDLPAHPGKALGSIKTRLRSRSANRQSASMLSTGSAEEVQPEETAGSRQWAGYGTDNDSIKTEDFENRFQKLMVGTETTGTLAADRTATGKKSSDTKLKTTAPERKTVTMSQEDEEMLQRLRVLAEYDQRKSDKPTPILSRPRSCSPTRPNRSEKKVVSYVDDSPRRDIAQESALIQRDIERERRARSVSPSPQSPPPPYSRPLPRPSSVTRRPMEKKSDLSSDISNMFANTSATFSRAEDALLAGHELKTIRQALFLTRKELKEAEAELKHARELSEDAKSSLMVTEFKRGNANKDLERINEDIRRKQNQLTSLDSEVKSKLQETRNLTSLGLTREDCIELKSMKEENACLKTKVRTLEALQLERDELVRQLEAAKDDVMKEQRQARVHRAELTEEIETLSAKLEEAQNTYGDTQVTMTRLEQAFRKMEKEKNEIIQAQNIEYEELKAQHHVSSNDTQQRLRSEMKELDTELTELKSRVSDLKGDNSTKEQLVEQLRAQLSDLQSVLAKERQERHKTSSEQKRSLQQLKKDTAAAVLKLKESMFLEKQRALEELRTEMEQERREFGSRNEDRLTQALEDKSHALSEATHEVSRLEDTLRRLEQDKVLEMDRRLNEAVNREREKADQEMERMIRQEREESQRRVKDLNAQIDRERQAAKELHRELTDLRKELEEQRRLQRETSKEKLIAVAKAKDQMKEQGNAEIERVKFNLQQEHQRDINLLEEKLRAQDDELIALRSENQDASMRERNVLQALENAERTVITELNEECSRAASILGISPRTVHHTSFHLETSDGRTSPSFKSRPVLNTALANLRACNEELHNHIAELQQEVESLRTMVETVTKEKEEAIENCKLQMEKQRTLDLEKLKDKLLKLEINAVDLSQAMGNDSTLNMTGSSSMGFDFSVDISKSQENLEIDAVDLSQTEAQFPSYTPNVSFRLDISRDSDDLGGNDHVQEMSQVIRQCAESNQKLAENNHRLADDNEQLMNNNQTLRRYGDVALMQALQAKEAELAAIRRDMAEWKKEAEAKYDTQLQLQMAKEREKYQALQHHSTREQKRISDLQKREINRLEAEVRKLAMSPNHTTDSNRLASSSPPPILKHQSRSQSPTRSLSPQPKLATPIAVRATSPVQKCLGGLGIADNNHKSSYQLQARIKQLQADNAALRKQRILNRANLNISMPDLSDTKNLRSKSPLGRSRSPTRDQRLGERIRLGEREALLAEERAKLNSKMMHNKMEEMAKLQQTLYSQNQELQELEKAYSDLNKQYKRTATPDPQLNTTV